MPVNCSVFLPPIIKQNKKHKTFSHFPVNLIWSIPFREERPNVMPLRKDKFLDGTSVNIRSEDYFWLCRSNSLPLCFFALFTCGDQGTLYDPVECWKEWGAQRQGGQGQACVCVSSERGCCPHFRRGWSPGLASPLTVLPRFQQPRSLLKCKYNMTSLYSIYRVFIAGGGSKGFIKGGIP